MATVPLPLPLPETQGEQPPTDAQPRPDSGWPTLDDILAVMAPAPEAKPEAPMVQEQSTNAVSPDHVTVPLSLEAYITESLRGNAHRPLTEALADYGRLANVSMRERLSLWQGHTPQQTLRQVQQGMLAAQDAQEASTPETGEGTIGHVLTTRHGLRDALQDAVRAHAPNRDHIARIRQALTAAERTAARMLATLPAEVAARYRDADALTVRQVQTLQRQTIAQDVLSALEQTPQAFHTLADDPHLSHTLETIQEAFSSANGTTSQQFRAAIMPQVRHHIITGTGLAETVQGEVPAQVQLLALVPGAIANLTKRLGHEGTHALMGGPDAMQALLSIDQAVVDTAKHPTHASVRLLLASPGAEKPRHTVNDRDVLTHTLRTHAHKGNLILSPRSFETLATNPARAERLTLAIRRGADDPVTGRVLEAQAAQAAAELA